MLRKQTVDDDRSARNPRRLHRLNAVLPFLLIACSAAPDSRFSDASSIRPPVTPPIASKEHAQSSLSDADSHSDSDSPLEPQLEKQIDDQIARLEAASATKDPKRCFGADTLLPISALALRLGETDRLDRATEMKWESAREAMKTLFRQCLELENGEVVAQNSRSTIEEILRTGDLFWMEAMIEKKSVRSLFSTPSCPMKDWPGAVDLAAVGGQGCIRLEPPPGESKNSSCPKLLLRNNDAVLEIGVVAGVTADGSYRSELLQIDNCCNLQTANLSVRRRQNEIQVHLTSEGRDCFGGTAYWIKEEIYRLDLKNKQLLLIEEIPIFER